MGAIFFGTLGVSFLFILISVSIVYVLSKSHTKKVEAKMKAIFDEDKY